MRCDGLAVMVAIIVGCGCGEGTPERARAEKPEQVIALAHQFMREGDAEGLWGLCSEASRAEFELMLGEIGTMPEAELATEFGVQKADIEGLHGKALMARFMASPVARKRMTDKPLPSVTRVELAGDDAATVRYTSGAATCEQRVVKVGDLWKLGDGGGKCSEPARPAPPAGSGAEPHPAMNAPGRAPEPAAVRADVESAPAVAAPAAAPAAIAEPAAKPGPAAPARARTPGTAPKKASGAQVIEDPFGN